MPDLGAQPTYVRPLVVDEATGAGVFPDARTRSRLLALYDAKLARWPVSFEELEIWTRHGRTHVVSAGPQSGPPIVLLHPAGCPAFVWRRLIGALAEHRRVHAIDTIGDVGKSVLFDGARFPRKGLEYSHWLGDVFDKLGIEQADLVGWSMGGWLALNFAADRPVRVRRLAVLAPMGLPSWPVTAKVLLRLASAAALPSNDKKQKLITWAIGNHPAAREEMGEWMSAVIDARCRTKLGNPLPIAGTKLHAIRARTLVLLAGNDGPIGDAKHAAKRARTHLREVEIEILPDQTHALGIEVPDTITSRLLAFFGDARRDAFDTRTGT
jgi:pimeloyl-ACP methyl ester carboxylesterase